MYMQYASILIDISQSQRLKKSKLTLAVSNTCHNKSLLPMYFTIFTTVSKLYYYFNSDVMSILAQSAVYPIGPAK